jgi:hypothetical protein
MMDGIKEESVGNLFNRQFEIQENPIVEEVGAGAQLAFGGNLPGVTGTAPAGSAAAATPDATAPASAASASTAPPSAGRRRRTPPAPPSIPEPAAPPAAFGKKPGGSDTGSQPSLPADGQPERPSGQQSGGRARGRHAADGRGHATAAGRGQAATRSGGAHAAGAPAAAADQTGSEQPAAGRATGPQVVAPAGLEPRRPRQLQYSAPADGGGVETHGDASLDPYANVGRNDLCPCGSGRKFKRCHGGSGRA